MEHLGAHKLLAPLKIFFLVTDLLQDDVAQSFPPQMWQTPRLVCMITTAASQAVYYCCAMPDKKFT